MTMKSLWTKVMVLFFTLSLLAACGGGGDSGGGGDGGGGGTDKLFYTVYDDIAGDSELYMIYGDNTGQRQLTFTGDTLSKEFQGLSPDGYVIYLYNKELLSVPLASPSAPTNVVIASDPTLQPIFRTITADSRVIYEELSSGKLNSVKTDGTGLLTLGGTSSLDKANYVGVTSTNLVVYYDPAALYSINPADTSTRRELDTALAGKVVGRFVLSSDRVVYSYSTDGVTYDLYKVDALAVTPTPELIDSGEIETRISVSDNYVFYSKVNSGVSYDLYAAQVNPVGTPVQLTSGAEDEYFEGFSPDPDNRVIYRKDVGGQDDLHSVTIDGTDPQLLSADASLDDVLKGITPDNRAVIQAFDTFTIDNTIISIKTDGTSPITLALANTNGGNVRLVTPDGWVIYESPYVATTTVASVKADGSSTGSFVDLDYGAHLGVTSNNRIVALEYTALEYQLYTVLPSGSDKINLTNTDIGMFGIFQTVVY